MTAFLHRHEPEDSFFYGLADSEEAVILEESGFIGAEFARDLLAFVGGKDDAVELGVENMVLYEVSRWSR